MPERFKERFSRDPFAITPDPAVYVPREATETARKQLLRSASNPTKTTALIGPPGLGKTLLLHLLAEEVPGETRTAYLPYAALPPEELCAWALGLLDSPATNDPIGALEAFGRELGERKSSLLLLIDDAGAMPIATARWAGELVQNSGGNVRLALAASDNATGNRVIAAIGSNFDIVHLNDSMTEDETRKYIDGRLELARVPASIRARFDDRTVRLLHRVSGGIPRRLHSGAAEILQEVPIATEDSRAAASAAPVEAPDAPDGSDQTLGASSDERRVVHRRAPELEGVPVRVGVAGAKVTKGRRAEDQIEAPPNEAEAAAEGSAEAIAEESAEAIAEESAEAIAEESAEAIAEESAEAAFEDSVEIESKVGEDADELGISDPDLAAAPALMRRPPPLSRRAIVLGSLFVAFVAVAIPAIRSILSEPRPIAALDPQANLQGALPGDIRQPKPGSFQNSKQGGFQEPGAAIESTTSAARDAVEIQAAAPAAEPLAGDPPALEFPSAGAFGPLAVQINASPWANVEVDGIDLGPTPLANIPLFAGAHSFRAKLPDGRVIERTIEIDAERRFISFE